MSEPLWFPEVAGDEGWLAAAERGLLKVCRSCGIQHMDSGAHAEECSERAA